MNIPKGKYGAHLNLINKILREYELVIERNFKIINVDDFLSSIRKLDYKETWKFYYSNSYYSFHLDDSSLLNFFYSSEKISYSYFGCPFDGLSYKDFLIDHGYSFEEEGESLISDYQQYLDDSPVVISPVTFRYDHDIESYCEGRHPISHLHIGHKNQIRLAIKYILDPFAFFCFVLRQTYPDIWMKIIESKEYHHTISKYKESIDLVSDSYFKGKDHYELYLM